MAAARDLPGRRSLPQLFPNQGIDDGLDPANPASGTFAIDFRHNLGVNFGFGSETLEFFDRYLAPTCAELAQLTPRGGGPVVRAVVVGIKPRGAAESLRSLSSAGRELLARRSAP